MDRQTTDTLIKSYETVNVLDENGKPTGEQLHNVPVRYMSPAEIKEREALNIANTASALRARVVAELAKSNGSNNGVTTTIQ